VWSRVGTNLGGGRALSIGVGQLQKQDVELLRVLGQHLTRGRGVCYTRTYSNAELLAKTDYPACASCWPHRISHRCATARGTTTNPNERGDRRNQLSISR
jgi:hypothetical protein